MSYLAPVPFVCKSEEDVRKILKGCSETAKHVRNVGGVRPWAAYAKSGVELARFVNMGDAIAFAAAPHALTLLRRNLSKERKRLYKARQITMFDKAPVASGHGDTD